MLLAYLVSGRYYGQATERRFPANGQAETKTWLARLVAQLFGARH